MYLHMLGFEVDAPYTAERNCSLSTNLVLPRFFFGDYKAISLEEKTQEQHQWNTRLACNKGYLWERDPTIRLKVTLCPV